MPKITYVQDDGTRQVVEVACGVSVMQGAVANGIEAIVAECGGNCACGTCRVYVDEPWLTKIGRASEMEVGTIEIREVAKSETRLSCQIEVTEDLDGLIVRMPKCQL